MCSFDVVIDVNKLKDSYAEYSDGLDVGGYFWVDKQIIEASGFGHTVSHSYD
jgi:hypothetical protein